MIASLQFESFAPLAPPEAVDRAASGLSLLMSEPRLVFQRILPLLLQPGRLSPITVIPLSPVSASVSVQLFVWAPGAATQIHDHSSWGAVGCAVGSLTEERFVRLDDGARLNHARLRRAWQRVWRSRDGISTFLPYAEGIHRVSNRTDKLAISLHCYGPAGAIDGRDYDPSRDYVCDRPRDRHEPRPRQQLR